LSEGATAALKKITAHLEQGYTNGAPSMPADEKGLILYKLNSVIYGITFKIMVALFRDIAHVIECFEATIYLVH
jgi:hypothetical protein